MKKTIFLMMIVALASAALGCAGGRSISDQPSNSEMTEQGKEERSKNEIEQASVSCKDDPKMAGAFLGSLNTFEGTITRSETLTGIQRQGSLGFGAVGAGGMKAGCGAETEEFMKIREGSPENGSDTITDGE